MQRSDHSDEYLIARRSLRLSPCRPGREDVSKFLSKEQEIPDEIVKSITLVHCREIYDRNLPAHRARDRKEKVEI